MEENKIDFDKYLERLEEYSENFKGKITENNEKIANLNQEIEKSTKAIEALGSYFKREEGTTSKSLTDFENTSRPYQNKIRTSEDEIRKTENENKELESKDETKQKIIADIIKDATEEWGAFEKKTESKKLELNEKKETEQKENLKLIDELKKKISVMDEVGNKNNRIAQEELEANISNIEIANEKIEEDYNKELKGLEKNLNKNKIEFKRKMNVNYLNSDEIGKILKAKAEKAKQQAEAEEELANQMADGREKAIKDREEAQIEEARESFKKPEEYEEPKPIQAATQEQPVQDTGIEGIKIDNETGEIMYKTGGKFVTVKETTIESVMKEKKYAFKRMDIAEKVKDEIQFNPIARRNLMKKIDPAVLKAIEMGIADYDEYQQAITNYIKALKGDKVEFPEIEYKGKSQYAKYAKEFAEIEGELAKGPVGRTIDGIKNISRKAFNKIKTLAPVQRIFALNEPEIENPELLERSEEEAKNMKKEQSIVYKNTEVNTEINTEINGVKPKDETPRVKFAKRVREGIDVEEMQEEQAIVAKMLQENEVAQENEGVQENANDGYEYGD